MDAAAERHPDVEYEPQLIDATFALLISSAGEPLVIPALNRDGDILSDLVLPLFGSIAGSESLLVAFNEDYTPRALMAEAAHGTAPALKGKNVANPMAMILAAAALLSHIDDDEARTAGPRDPRGVARGRLGGHPHRRPRRSRLDDRVHGRGPLPHPLEAGGLGDARRGLSALGRYLRSLDPRLPRSVWILSFGGLANAVGNGLAYPFLVIYLHNVRGFSLGTAGLVLATNGAVSLACGPGGGHRRRPVRRAR